MKTASRAVCLASVCFGSLLLAGHCVAQCAPQWIDAALSNTQGEARAMLWMTDPASPATGNRLYVAGTFAQTQTLTANSVAKWDGTTWSALGSGVRSVFGATLFPGSVYALAKLPDGALVAGGSFSLAGSANVSNIARWNGTEWSPLGSGVQGAVLALAVLPSGNLVAGGQFTQAGTTPVLRIAAWDGAAWSPMGNGFNADVEALAVLPSGDLVAAGSFSASGTAPTSFVATWNGTQWTNIGTGLFSGVSRLLVRSNGELLGGLSFSNTLQVVRWNGASWSTLRSWPAQNFAAITESPSGDVWAASSSVSFTGQYFSDYQRLSGGAWSMPLATNSWKAEAIAFAPNGELLEAGSRASQGSLVPQLQRYTFNGTPWAARTPGNATVACGGQTSMRAQGASGLGTLSYQWSRAGVPLVNQPGAIQGANTSLLFIIGATSASAGTYTCTITNSCGSFQTPPAMLTVTGCVPACDTTDFNRDGLFPDTVDIDDFLSVFSGGPCSTNACNDIDFNNDSLFPDIVDIDSLLSVFSGGPCL
jgi:hypothetical protein